MCRTLEKNNGTRHVNERFLLDAKLKHQSDP